MIASICKVVLQDRNENMLNGWNLQNWQCEQKQNEQ